MWLVKEIFAWRVIKQAYSLGCLEINLSCWGMDCHTCTSVLYLNYKHAANRVIVLSSSLSVLWWICHSPIQSWRKNNTQNPIFPFIYCFYMLWSGICGVHALILFWVTGECHWSVLGSITFNLKLVVHVWRYRSHPYARNLLKVDKTNFYQKYAFKI